MRVLRLLLIASTILLISFSGWTKPFISVRMNEHISLYPNPALRAATSLMMRHGEWFAISQSSATLAPTTSVTQMMMEVGLRPMPELSVSAGILQMPAVMHQTMWVSGHLSLFSETLLDSDPMIRAKSSVTARLPLAPIGEPSVKLTGDIAATLDAHRLRIYGTVVPAPLGISAIASGSVQIFATDWKLGDHTIYMTGSAVANAKLVPINWGYWGLNVTARVQQFSGTLSATFVPETPVSISLSVSHPLELL